MRPPADGIFPDLLVTKMAEPKPGYEIGNALWKKCQKKPTLFSYPVFQLRTLPLSSFVSFATEPQHVLDRSMY
jgi:hypothetical protein